MCFETYSFDPPLKISKSLKFPRVRITRLLHFRKIQLHNSSVGLHVIGINDKISLNIIIKAEFLSDIIGELYYYFLQNRSSSCFDSIGVSLPLPAVSEKNKSVFLFFQHWLTLKTVIEKFFAIKYMNFGSIDVYRFFFHSIEIN